MLQVIFIDKVIEHINPTSHTSWPTKSY